MKVLVTGGSGFLGTHIRKFFAGDDFSRRANLDILSLNDIGVIGEYDVVIHLAAILDKSPENTEHIFLTNVEGTVNVLRSMRKDAVFIFASTKDVYGAHADNFEEIPERCLTDYDAQSPLEWSKLIAEKYVEYFANMNNFRSCIFRLSNVYAKKTEQNESNLVLHYIDAINQGLPLRIPAKGEPKRDFMHVNDFAGACQKFIDSDVRHGLYNLGGGHKNAVTLNELIKKIENLTGGSAVIDENAEISAPIPFNYVSDISKIEHELDWKPKIALDEGLKIISGSDNS